MKTLKPHHNITIPKISDSIYSQIMITIYIVYIVQPYMHMYKHMVLLAYTSPKVMYISCTISEIVINVWVICQNLK